MKIQEKKPFAKAMAFYHQDGLPAAWKQAMQFAGEGGRLATMPDIVAARLATKPGDAPWGTYYTTLSAEYLGFSKSSGRRILVVAHGVGPMSTLDGILKAYSWEFKDKNRDRRGGRITQQEFWDLEAGKYGEVYIIDLDKYCRGYEYPFMETLTEMRSRIDPVLLARFGLLAKQYIAVHAEHARRWHLKQAGVDPENKYGDPDFEKFLDRRRRQHFRNGAKDGNPYIIKMEGAANCYYGNPEYGYRSIEDGYAIAHLLSTGGLTRLLHEGSESLVLDVSCHEWGNGVRMVGIQSDGNTRSGIQTGPDADRLLHKYWKELLIPVFPSEIKTSQAIGIRALMKIEKQWFTHYLKKGERMDTWEPEYVVTSAKKIGKPVPFRTTICGYHMFFRFGINEVKAIAPSKANAYFFVTEPECEWHDGNPTHHNVMVQFYRIEADTTKRLMRTDQLCHDYERMMKLLKKEGEAA